MALRLAQSALHSPRGVTSATGRDARVPAGGALRVAPLRVRQLACRAAANSELPADDTQHAVRARAAAACLAVAVLCNAGAAQANRDRVAEFAASGLIFKDTIDVTALDDPEIDGVTIYITDFQRNLRDRLAKDPFSDPSQASLTCAITGPVNVKDISRISGSEGHEVFSESKGLNLFKSKTLRVRRVYDAERRTVLYVAFSTRLSTATDEGGVSTGRYRTSICALGLPAPAPAPSPVADAPAAAP